MLYLDTSALIKIYITEQDSDKIIDYLAQQQSQVALCKIHDLEFTNAINLMVFWKRITAAEQKIIFQNFKSHEEQEAFVRPSHDLSEVFSTSEKISHKYSSEIGCRSLDILQLAFCLELGCKHFISFDERQIQLAKKLKLKTISL
jgi:predicted nucleic acid-binding protein